MLGALFAWPSSGATQPSDGSYASYLRMQPYAPSYYVPPPSHIPPSSYIPTPNYNVLPDHQAQRLIPSVPYVGYDGRPVYAYAPPLVTEFEPLDEVLILLRPRSCGEYRYWNGEYCADARYERPYLGAQR
jgi:hypothetical protein